MTITWGVCKNEGTQTIFCLDCKKVFKTVKLGEAILHIKEIKEKHVCIKDNLASL